MKRWPPPSCILKRKKKMKRNRDKETDEESEAKRRKISKEEEDEEEEIPKVSEDENVEETEIPKVSEDGNVEETELCCICVNTKKHQGYFLNSHCNRFKCCSLTCYYNHKSKCHYCKKGKYNKVKPYHILLATTKEQCKNCKLNRLPCTSCKQGLCIFCCKQEGCQVCKLTICQIKRCKKLPLTYHTCSKCEELSICSKCNTDQYCYNCKLCRNCCTYIVCWVCKMTLCKWIELGNSYKQITYSCCVKCCNDCYEKRKPKLCTKCNKCKERCCKAKVCHGCDLTQCKFLTSETTINNCYNCGNEFCDGCHQLYTKCYECIRIYCNECRHMYLAKCRNSKCSQYHCLDEGVDEKGKRTNFHNVCEKCNQSLTSPCKICFDIALYHCTQCDEAICFKCLIFVDDKGMCLQCTKTLQECFKCKSKMGGKRTLHGSTNYGGCKCNKVFCLNCIANNSGKFPSHDCIKK